MTTKDSSLDSPVVTPETKYERSEETSKQATEAIHEQKKEFTPKEIECKDFIENNKKSLVDALTQLISEKHFILLGEKHTPDCEEMRENIAASLISLQKAGLTHIALEANHIYQTLIDELDYSDPNVLEKLKDLHIGGAGWYEGNYLILKIAKLIGLEVILIDHNDDRHYSLRNNASWQNERDGKMSDLLASTNPSARTLVFIGSAHVHKKSVEKYPDGYVKRLGARLVERFGNDDVASIRHVSKTENFDNLLEFISQTPTPKRLSKGANEIVIIPDAGPLKGDSRVSAADYIITQI